MDPDDSEVNLSYIPNMQEREAAVYSRSSVRKRKVTTKWQAEIVDWSIKERGSRSKREVAKRSGRHELRRNDSKGSFVPRKKDEDAAALLLFFDNGRRKPVECSRKDGHCNVGAVREQQ